MRQGTSQSQLSAANSMIANLQNAMLPIYEHFEVWDQGLENSPDLSERNSRMFSLLMLRVFHALRNSYYQQKEGSWATDWYRVHITGISAFTRRTGGVIWWNQNRERFSEEFRDLVDKIATSAPLGKGELQ